MASEMTAQRAPSGEAAAGPAPGAGAASEALWSRARAVLAGGVGHDLRHAGPTPLYAVRGAGGRKWDADGKEYVDFLLGNGALLLGHAHPAVVQAVQRTTALGTHFGNDHPLQIEWAEQIQRLVPSAERVRFTNSGTEATQLALRLARAATGRPKVLRFAGHFHGWHDALIDGSVVPFDRPASLGVPDAVRALSLTVPDGDLDAVEAALRADPQVGAVILEPSGASWGRVPLETAFLRGLRRLTAERGVVLIFDEVVTGFRWSPGGLQAREGVVPDLTALAKIMAGGLPGGALVGRAPLMALFDFTGDPRHDRYERVAHLGTFNASPPSAAAGLAALGLVATGEPTARADALAARLREAFDAVLERRGVAGYVYGDSSTFHVYFETDPARVAGATSRRRDLRTADPVRLKGLPAGLVGAYQRGLRERGVDIMSSTGGGLSSAHTEADLAWAVEAFDATVAGLLQQGLVLAL